MNKAQGANLFRIMIWKEFQQIRRDKFGLRLMILMPLLQMLVLGSALTSEVKHTPVAVLDHSRSPESRSLVQSVVHNPLFDFKGHADSESELRKRLDRGIIKLALILPSDFSLQLERALALPFTGDSRPPPRDQGAKVQIWVDGQDANSAGVARGYLTTVLNQWARERLQERLASQGLQLEQIIPLGVDVKILFNPSLKSSWYMVPGIAVILITMVTALLTGFSIVREKEAGTLEQLMATPLRPIHILLGKTFPFFLIGIAELMVALILAQAWFGVPFHGRYLTLVAFSAAYMLSSLGLGILTSTIARTQQQALFIIWFFLVFFLLLSGFFMPVENMPEWVRTLTYLNPVRYFMHVLREIFLKGSGFQELWREGLAMLAIGFTVFSLALLKFNRQAA